MKRYANPRSDPSTEIKNSVNEIMDVLGLNIVMSEEAVKEIDDYFESPASMVDSNGKLIRDLENNRGVKYAFFCVTYHPLD